MSQPQVWPRRQEAQQWGLTGPASMKEVERTNVVMIYPTQQAGFVLHNPYAIGIGRGNRNYCSCGGFGHLAWNCRRQTMGQGKRMEYKDNWNNRQNNLNGEEDLIVLDYVSIITTDSQCSLE